MATKKTTDRVQTAQETVENANGPNTGSSNSATRTGDAKNLTAKVERPAIPKRKRNDELDKTRDSTGNITTS